MSAKLPSAIVTVARQEIGVEEVDRSNCGPRVNEYKAATWLDATKSWPWCAAFVCWFIREAMRFTGIKETPTFKRPRTAGAWDFERWCKEQDGSVILKKPHERDIEPGDIVIFTFSHIGVATTRPDENGFLYTIEGNTDGEGSREGGAVLRKKRHVSKIRSRLRFTI